MLFLQCSFCGEKRLYNRSDYRCSCGNFYDIKVSNDFRINENLSGFWRFLSVLPLEEESDIIGFGEQYTPLELSKINNQNVWIKHDYLFPSGSYKDRGAAVLISRLKQEGIHEIVEDSSGNAGASIACYAARAGIKCRIVVPEETSGNKIRQISAYGANVIKVSGGRERAAAEAIRLSSQIYYASHVSNPLFYQGIKTLAYELVDQFKGKFPDKIIIPVGNGTLTIGLFLGFSEMIKYQLIQKMPAIIGVQAENCAPMAGEVAGVLKPDIKKTIAEGIAIAEPRRKNQIISAILGSGGCFLTVSEDEIINALHNAMLQGYFIEPTSAVVWAAFSRYIHLFDNNEINILVLTGHGLKTSVKQ